VTAPVARWTAEITRLVSTPRTRGILRSVLRPAQHERLHVPLMV